MGAIRRLVRQHLSAAWALLALALLMKVLVPAGFMPAVTAAGIELVICPGTAPAAPTMPAHVAMAMPGMAGHQGGDHPMPAKPEAPCAFAGLAAPWLGGADPVQLAIALVAIFVAALFPGATSPARPAAYLRPPLRGPPARG